MLCFHDCVVEIFAQDDVAAPQNALLQAVAPAEVEERDEDDEFGGNRFNGPGAWKLIQEWIGIYEESSDFVRVRGLPPAADELQFIDRERIKEAQEREPQSLDDDPLICGVDVSGGGAAWNVAAFRRGGDARSIPRIRIPGEHTRDRSVLVGKLAEILRDKRPDRKVTAMFIDTAFGRPIYGFRCELCGGHAGRVEVDADRS